MYPPRVRHFLAILLIAASLIHPFVHSGDDAKLCPGTHASVDSVILIFAAALVVLGLMVRAADRWDGHVDRGALPARAPPIAV